MQRLDPIGTPAAIAAPPAAEPGTRTCPQCGCATAIADHERVWPLDWHCPACGRGVDAKNGIPILAPELDGQVVGVDPAAFEELDAWENDHFWFVARNELIAWLLRRHCPAARRVMEIGCGTGYVINALRSVLPGAHIVGSELHSSGLAFARQRHGESVEFVQLDARALHVQQAFDAICAFDVIEHVTEDTLVLRQIHAALKPAGLLLATVPQHTWLWSPYDEISHHVRRYARGELKKKAIVVGFEVLVADSFTSLLLPLMVGSRIATRLRRKDKGADAALQREIHVSPGMNAALLAVQRCEHAMRRIGLRMPVGGSQVVVARKAPPTAQDAART